MEQKLNTLAETLFNSGLAGSPNEAKRMAEEMLSTSEKVMSSSEQDQKTNISVKQQERAVHEPTTQRENSGNKTEADKQEENKREFRERALSGNSVDIQMDFDTPQNEKNRNKERDGRKKFEEQFQASDIPQSHSEYKTPDTMNAEYRSQYEEHKTAEQNTAPSPQNTESGFDGSLLEQAMRNVKEAQNSSEAPTPEEHTARKTEEEEKARMQTAEEKMRQAENRLEKTEQPTEEQSAEHSPQNAEQPTAEQNTEHRAQGTEDSTQTAAGNSGKRREMTEEKEQQDEVDLTKHFNFSN